MIVRRLTSTFSTYQSPAAVAVAGNLNFVPKHLPPRPEDVEALQKFVDENNKIFILTGAGVSTESGIPDYRSEDVGLFARSTQRPMKIQEFLSSPSARRRYWARNFFAWPRFSAVHPNITHFTLRQWELNDKVTCLVTQNVDGLHKRAGSAECVELHGSAHRVNCIACSYTIERRDFQNVLMEANQGLSLAHSPTNQIRPDGDITIDEDTQKRFVIPPCPSCGGVLKPDIVFFGDNVPRDKVYSLYDYLDASDSILVLGSSLQTFSAFRYLVSGKQLGKRIAILTLGPTRGDNLTDLKLSCRVGEILPAIRL